MSNISKKIYLVIKIIITIGLITFLLSKVNWDEVWVVLENASLLFLILTFALMVFSVYVSAYKWKILLEIHNIHFSFYKLSKYYYMGSFFNNFLPSTIGGDSYRIFKTFSDSYSKASPVMAVLMERISGMILLLIVGSIGALISFLMTKDMISYYVVLSGFVLFFLVFLFMYLYIIKKSFFLKLFDKYAPKKIKKNIHPLRDFRGKKKEIIRVFYYSLIFNLILILSRLTLLYAVGSECNFYELSVVVMVSNIIALVPITINGLGLRDGIFIYLLQNYGVLYEPALIVMLLSRILTIPLSLIGGLYYLSDKKSISKEDYKKSIPN